jgi:hypothetical protein
MVVVVEPTLDAEAKWGKGFSRSEIVLGGA